MKIQGILHRHARTSFILLKCVDMDFEELGTLQEKFKKLSVEAESLNLKLVYLLTFHLK